MRHGLTPRVAALVAVLGVLLALAAAAPAAASPGAVYGIQDDAWLADGPGTVASRVATLRGLGVGLVRFTLRWNAVARTRPAQPRDPRDPAYDWGAAGEVLDALHTAGIPVLVTLYGSPAWANGGHGATWLPTSGFGDFAAAAAAEFPWVRLWTVWNEPNSRTFSVPVSPAAYVRGALNPAYAALHAASAANLVGGGVTSPRQTPSGMSPLAYLRGMRAAHARLDAYAQNPYPVARTETPASGPCTACFTMASLARIRREVTANFGGKPLWLTEYGYQTDPPDRLLGVAPSAQAAYLGEAALKVWRAPGVTMLVQFLVRDEPSLGGWQSGLVTAGGTPKPSYHAFALPLAQAGRDAGRAVLWGQIRPGSGARPFALQRAVGAAWRTVGGARETAADGVFSARLALPPGTRVRVFDAAVGWASPPLTLR